MADLSNLRVAVLVTDGFEKVELTKPVQALQEAEAIEFISPNPVQIQACRHHDKGMTVSCNRTLDESKSSAVRTNTKGKRQTSDIFCHLGFLPA